MPAVIPFAVIGEATIILRKNWMHIRSDLPKILTDQDVASSLR